MYEQPYRHYWRALYPEFAVPIDGALVRQVEDAEMCIGLFGERQRARHEWIA